MHGYDEVPDDQHDAHHQEETGYDVGDREQLGDVDVAGVGAPAQPGDAATYGLPQGAGDVAAVERQQRHEVEQADEEVEAGDQAEQSDQLVPEREVLRGDRLSRQPPAAHDADGAVGVACLDAGDRLRDPPDLHRQRGERLGGLPGEAAHGPYRVDRAAATEAGGGRYPEEPDGGQLGRV